jgi:hypothetical protein
MKVQAHTWRSMGVSFTVVALCLYVPFSWILLLNYPWSAYRLFWLKLWPILPGCLAGFLPGPLLYGAHLPYELETMGVTTVLLLIMLTWLGFLSRRWLAIAAGIALLISVPSAVIAYGIFRA